nr:30S ribosomal protein S6 [Corynebacterium sp. TAE3-ERU12]
MRSVRHYEVMIILDPSIDERTAGPSLEKFLDVVRKDKGEVTKVDIWGKRHLAYPIEKKNEGVYAVVELNCEPDTVKEMDRRLNLTDSVLRTKVLRGDR